MDDSPFPGYFGGVGSTVACESALSSAGTLLSRVRAPLLAPWPDGGPESLRSPCCGLAIYKKLKNSNSLDISETDKYVQPTMYKHRSKSSRDESVNSTRPSTQASGRSSQLSNISDRPASGSKSKIIPKLSVLDSTGKKEWNEDPKVDIKAKKTSKNLASVPPDAASPQESISETIQAKRHEEKKDKDQKSGDKVGVREALTKESSKQMEKKESMPKNIPEAMTLASNLQEGNANESLSNEPEKKTKLPTSSKNSVVAPLSVPSTLSSGSIPAAPELPLATSSGHAIPSNTIVSVPAAPPSLPEISVPPPPPPPPVSSQQDLVAQNQSNNEDHSSKRVDGILAKSIAEYASSATGKLGNIKIDPNQLLNQKRRLKKVDRHIEYNPVTLSRKELFEEEYERNGETPPEHFPLHVVKPTIVSENISADLFTLNLNGIDQLTDLLFPLLLVPNNSFMNLKKLLLNGCLNLTDQALKWIARLFPTLQMLELNACRNITEKGLHHIFQGCPALQNLSIMGTNVSLIPDSIMDTKIPKGSIQWAGSSVISESQKFRTFRGADEERKYFEAAKRKVVILREAYVTETVTPLLTGDKSKSSKFFCYKQWQDSLNAGSSQLPMQYNIFEVEAFSPLQDSLVTGGSIILIACKPPSKPEEIQSYALKVAELITSVLIKCPDVLILLAEITENGIATTLEESVSTRLNYLIHSMQTATYDLYKRNWNLECLDFKGQQGLGFGITAYEALQNLIESKTMVSAAVTKESFQKTVSAILSQCSDRIKALVPWVHCEWEESLKEVFNDLPKVAAGTQEDISDKTDKATATILHKRYSYPRIGKVINLLQNWGEAMYYWHPWNILCVTDLSSYENVLVKLMTSPASDKVKISFCEDAMPCYTLSSIQSFLKSHNVTNVEPKHLTSLLKRQGILLSVPPHMLEDSKESAQEIYIKMNDLLEEPKSLKYLWPEPTPVKRVLQHNRCYNFLPAMPALFMSKLLRTLLKVFQPLCVWKTGFLVRQGPVDVKATLLKYKGERLDDTPVLVISARVIHLGMDIKIRPDVDDYTSTTMATKVMYACVRQVMTVVDYTCLKTKVYPCITFPCPECAQFKTEEMVNIEHNWHLPYYIALASKRRKCPTHKNITAGLLFDLGEEQGEGCVIPQHNFCYQSAASKFVKQQLRQVHFREMDPPEKCFYCGRDDEEPCLRCVMCSQCLRHFAKFAKVIQPGHVTSQSFKLQMVKDGQLQDDERIISNTKGCVYFYKRGHSMQMLDPMTPFYWDQLVVTALKSGNFYIHLTFGSGKRLEYHSSGVIIDQHGKSHTNDFWKCRDASCINIRMEAVELGKRVQIIIQLKEKEVYREEIDGWYMKFDLNTGKPGIYILHAPGIKLAWNFNNNGSSFFTVGSTLEVKDGNEVHPAVIKEQKKNGYLILDVNGKDITYIHSSPNLMPTGTAEIIGESLGSELPVLDKDQPLREPVPLRAFKEYQVPSGFEPLFEKSEKDRLSMRPKLQSQGASNSESTAADGQTKFKKGLLARCLEKCTFFTFPSVLYARQTHMREIAERSFYNDGKWNFSMNALLLLPKLISKEDLLVPSQNIFTRDFKLHPLCYFRGDITTVMSSSPTNRQQINLECFHNLHMVDNEGIDLDLTGKLGGFLILWAWSLLLLRLQMEKDLTEYKSLVKGIDKVEELTPKQVNKGFRSLVQAVSNALFLGLGEGFDFKSSLTEDNIKPWESIMMNHAENQGLVQTKSLFVYDIWLMCETHAGCWQVDKSLEKFSSLPGPYSRFIYSLSLSNNNIKEIPSSLFAGLPHLKDLDLSCNQLVELPDEIGMCSELTSINVFDNQLRTLPEGMCKCEKIFRIFMDKNDMLELPPVVTQLKNLQRLYAQFLHLRSLPENIGDLTELRNLSLNGNCFKILPDSMRKLTKLTNLSLNGVAWMKSRGNAVLSKDHFEDFLKGNNLHRWLERYDQDRSSIFQFFDEDTNGTLDSKEIGKLNAIMFHIFPRFGYQGNDPDEDTPSGFPEVLFELPNLEYLSLQYHGLVSIPENIKNLTKLHTLILGCNPNLLTISAQIGNNPLKRLELEGCPRLKTPPKEIRAKGFVTTFAYLRRLLSGSVTCKRTKLMLVGLGGAGKTSLVKSLMSKEKCAELTIGEEITDGIDICPWTVPTEEGDITYSVWDFAGQTVYYNTHQFFLSDRAVYLLLWNIRLGHEHAGLSFWLSSISVHAPNAPIFVVGTHVDQVSKIELPVSEMQKKFPQIYGFHFVSSHTGQGISELQQHLVGVTLKQKYMGEKVPGVWLSLEKSLKSMTDKKVIHFGELRSKANRCGIFDDTEVNQAVQFLHALGSVQHFTNANLKSHVVINPQWIVDVMASVVSVKDSPIKAGRLKHSDLGKVWKEYKSNLHKWMLKLTEEFDLTFPLKDEQVNLVPCLLPEKKPEFTWPEFEKGSYNRHNKIVYKFDYLPAGLFNRGQVRLHQFSDSSLIWKRGSYLKKNQHVCLIYQSEDSELTVKAYGPRPENIVLLVHEVFETLILESFKGITYDFYLPCPDCMSMVLKDPHMFSASIIRRATELKAPFLQCLKYFHTISITDLHALMPPDSSLDFDLHLVQAVRGLKELQENVSADVFVCFCPDDLEKKDAETVVPSKVAKDVQKLGYKCWLSQNISTESTDEMAKALLDAKVFLVFMSNNFVQDETCCNLYKYARLTLKKSIILVAIGEDLSWKQSSMGILMADEVFVNMMKASRYPHKFPELEMMLQDKLCPEKKAVKRNFPPCFISYSWQNSAQAVAKGSKSTEGAVGYGDPRDIKDFLEKNGIKCWIDVERVGIHGLFEDIGEGLINSRIVVVCISDQYAASDNCAMEFRYAANSLKLPIVLAVVGTGNKWRASELGIMSLNYPLVSFQEKSSNSMEKLLSLVRNHIPISSDDTNKEVEKKLEKEDENNLLKEQQQLSFQELCELAQRKFLKQVSQYTDNLDSLPYPNIMVIDLLPEERGQIEISEKVDIPEKSGETLPKEPPQEKILQSTESLNFHDQSFCVHLLCEHEEGWHMSGKPIQLSSDFGHSLEFYLAYLARVTAIAKFSKKIILEAQANDVGRAYLKWLEENPNVAASTDFQESYGQLRQLVIDLDTEGSMGDLQQCLLPSGKYIWLCEAHRREMRVTVVARESVTSTAQHKNEVLGIDYMLQALEELNMDTLPQQMRNRRIQQASEEVKEKTQDQAATNVSSHCGLKSEDVSKSTGTQKETSSCIKDTPTKTDESAGARLPSAQRQELQTPHLPQQQQQTQRPTLSSRANSRSRACLLM
ncbi:leucine-rich repeat serine/threonine-protein kinase 1 [Plakobranchus ocellatus]|uniref:non-specific serine/threonine protein kinase n=1 Tax=Plakobranchus ocellatus TaxID=259542 RepID=A0AAV4D1I0_9GAST|nr:leucine-rich repeat serine/threonine-protein kinase 1 [Plakobranchus ocellatus]